MRNSVLTTALACFALAACEAPPQDDAAATDSDTAAGSAEPAAADEVIPGEPQMSPEPADSDDSKCGADEVGEWLNSLPTNDVKASIAETVGDRPIRYYNQGDLITMDFNPARLNVELGEGGRIKLFRCG